MWHEWTTQLRGLKLDRGCGAALTLSITHTQTDTRVAARTPIFRHILKYTYTYKQRHPPPPNTHTHSRVCARTHKRTHRGDYHATEFWTLRVRRRLKNCTHHQRIERAQQREAKNKKKTPPHAHSHTYIDTLRCELPVCRAAYRTASLCVRPVRPSWQPEQREGKWGKEKNKGERWGGEKRNKEWRKRQNRELMEEDGENRWELKRDGAMHNPGPRATSLTCPYFTNRLYWFYTINVVDFTLLASLSAR